MKFVFLLSLLLLVKSISVAQVMFFEIKDSKLNKPLMHMLDTLYKEDQDSRLEMSALSHSKAPAAKIDSLHKLIHEKDLKNIAKVNNIIAQYGWLSPQKVGMNGSQALFLVIQHADLATQERYLPMIKKAEKDGETFSSNLAILEDRIAVREGRDQIYGSQGFTDKATGKAYPYPIIDPDHLDDRRKTVGLIPMSEYRKASNSPWDLETYKKMLPEIEILATRNPL